MMLVSRESLSPTYLGLDSFSKHISATRVDWKQCLLMECEICSKENKSHSESLDGV